jgi:hypothetical protein
MSNDNRQYTAANDNFILQNYGRLSFVEIGRRMGLTKHQVRGRWLRIRHRGPPDVLPEEHLEDGQVQYHGQGDVTTVSLKSRTVRSLDEAIQAAKVDEKVWEITEWKVRKWDVTARIATEQISETRWERTLGTNELWYVSLTLKRRRPLDLVVQKEEMLAQLKAAAPSYPAIVHRAKPRGPHMLEVGLFDVHFGKLAWGEETGDNCDIKIIERAIEYAVDDLIARAAAFNFDQVLLPLGNDLIHVDTPQNTTTLGTRQDVDSRIKKIIRRCREIMVRQVLKLVNLAPVVVRVVPGNHDGLVTWTLGEALECWFHNASAVTIDNGPKVRKYHLYGKNLLGFTHGSDEKINDLPGIMAIEVPKLWSQASFRQWHIGHLHKAKEHRFLSMDGSTGVITRTLPSLSGTDAWHYQNGYVGNAKAAQAFVWHAANGCVAEFTCHIPQSFYR